MFLPFPTRTLFLQVTSLYFPLRMFYQDEHESGGQQVWQG